MTNSTIGGTAPGAGNVIGGFGRAAIFIYQSNQNAVQGNFIGTNAAGANLGNGAGMLFITRATNNVIGGTAAGAGNTIAFNGQTAPFVGGGGVILDSSAGTGNSIRGNSIHDNGDLGIDLGGDGVTLNDSVGHVGPNNYQNFPVLASVASSGGTTTVAGTLNSMPNTTFALDFYANVTPDPSGYGEGQTYLGSANVTTDGTGTGAFTAVLTAGVPAGQVVTATATAPDGSTLEFSAAKFLTQTVIKNVGLLLLDPTGQSLNVSGNAVITVTNNGVIVLNSTNSAAATASGNASVTATEIDDHGGLTHSGNAAFHGTIVTGSAAMTDPLAALAAPTQPATQFSAVNYHGTLQPGTYVGGITVSGNNSVNLQPGIYYLSGAGLTVSGNATMTGVGVTVYVTGLTGGNPTAVNISGNAQVTLTPPTSGPDQGIVLWENRALAGAITVSGSGVLNTTGTVYAAAAKVNLSGNDTTDTPAHSSLGSEWIVADLALSGNAHFTVTADANNRVVDPNAFLVAGGPAHPAVSPAGLTQAAAQAAVTEAVALWRAAGLDAGTAAALARTKVVVEPLPAPYLGLAAPGTIYLDPTAEGYGWFTATAPGAKPPAGAIDLLTVVSHELGHEFGLLDGDGTPLMAPALAAGIRILPTAADLVVPHQTLTAVGAMLHPTAAASQAVPAGVLDFATPGPIDWLTATAVLRHKGGLYADWLPAAGAADA